MALDLTMNARLHDVLNKWSAQTKQYNISPNLLLLVPEKRESKGEGKAAP
jgi:hypothetical protein